MAIPTLQLHSTWLGLFVNTQPPKVLVTLVLSPSPKGFGDNTNITIFTATFLGGGYVIWAIYGDIWS